MIKSSASNEEYYIKREIFEIDELLFIYRVHNDTKKFSQNIFIKIL